MINKKREIYIKLQNVEKIVDLLTEIKQEEAKLKAMFDRHDKLNSEENKLFENWNNYLEEVVQKLDHVSL